MRRMMMVGLMALPGCGLAAHRVAPAAPVTPACVADADGVVRFEFGTDGPDCDVRPPQRLVMTFPGADGVDADWVAAECAADGGFPVVLRGDTAECRVDY